MTDTTYKLREELENTPGTMVILPNKLKGETTTIVRIPLERLRALIESNSKELLDRVERDVIGVPLKDDITYTPTLEDPYGTRHLMDTTKTSLPKYEWNYGSLETVKRQHSRLNQLRKQEGLQ